ncbi:MAG: aspartate aminotransferase family protein [Myxococcales bacterium]|nr:aspartate aminotransferase family protein [Myxococcales bacterium]
MTQSTPPSRRPEHSPAVQRYVDHVNPAFIQLLGAFGSGRVFVRAEGMKLWDDHEREYLDFLGGFGAINLGHNPAELAMALTRALDEKHPNILHVGPQIWAGELGAALAERFPRLPVALFSCSGGEAVEAAIKLARAASKRPGIVYASGGFHGTGLGNLSVMGFARWRKPFRPLIPDCHEVPFGDLEALKNVLKRRKIAGVLLEPIQGEAGVLMPPGAYLAGVQALCRKHGALFMLDEIQTGLARTGRLCSYQHESDLDPDVVILGKSLGGSLIPISATLTRTEIQKRAYGSVFKFDLHGSTLSGNALGCRVALETLRLIDAWGLCGRAQNRGEQLQAGLEERLSGHPLVRAVRGQGLLVGLELGPTGSNWVQRHAPRLVKLLSRQVLGQWLSVRLLERGLLTQPASQQWDVLKLTPPLTVSAEEVDTLVATIGEILDEYRDLTPLVLDVTKRLGDQKKSGWLFR